MPVSRDVSNGGTDADVWAVTLELYSRERTTGLVTFSSITQGNFTRRQSLEVA